MHVVWRRPDGFHGATPNDFKVVEIAGHSRIWLHKTDRDWFPFRISGGWQDDEATRRLNCLVNLVNEPDSEWVARLVKSFHHSVGDDPASFLSELETWLGELKTSLKGDKWEIEIMNETLIEIVSHIEKNRAEFLKSAHA